MADQRACRLCRHRVWDHNILIGCEFCSCLATRGEASPRTENEEFVTPISSVQCLAMYRKTEKKEEPMPQDQRVDMDRMRDFVAGLEATSDAANGYARLDVALVIDDPKDGSPVLHGNYVGGKWSVRVVPSG